MEHEELIARERRFWEAAGDADFYRRHFAEDGRCVFAMAILDKDQTVAAMQGASPWTDVDMREVTVTAAGEDVAALTYSASAAREGQPPYAANVGSVYVRRDGDWQLWLHQQTPLA